MYLEYTKRYRYYFKSGLLKFNATNIPISGRCGVKQLPVVPRKKDCSIEFVF